ncbi:MAG: hypothetical protein H6740_18310 [Alphaproteobacteria bacterium]|nr:hypothetical protein [Alphaproteobacteria bacterium]
MRIALLTALLSVSCAQALRPVPGSEPLRYEGELAFELPEGWALTRQRRLLSQQAVTLTTPHSGSAVTVKRVREGEVSRGLPLSIVAEVLSVDAGRSLGVDSTLVGLQQLDVDGREAWVATVRRRHGPVERIESSVYVRGERHLVIVSLHTNGDAPVEVLRDWDGLLGSLDLVTEPPPPSAPFAADARWEAELDAAEPWR